MHLYVAILPPPGVCEAVAEVVRTAEASVETAVETPAPAGRFGRGRKRSEPESSGEAHPQLDHVALSEMQLPIATFGNVTVADSERLAEVLTVAAAKLTSPTVHLTGGAELEFPGDQSLWVRVQGDLDTLRLIPPGMTQTVEPLGFFVDRRKFRPLLSVCTVTEATTPEVRQRVIDALDAFQGEPWTVGSVSLRQRLLDSNPAGSKLVADIPLGSG